MRVAFAADHAGAAFKDALIARLEAAALGHELIDLGGDGSDPHDDYPDFAERLGRAIQAGEADRGILICGSGVGASVAANKLTGIRAAVCHDTYSAHQGVEHDDMNVLTLGSRVIGPEPAFECAVAFLAATFSGEPATGAGWTRSCGWRPGGTEPAARRGRSGYHGAARRPRWARRRDVGGGAEPGAGRGRLHPTRSRDIGGDTLIHSVGLWRPVLHRSRSDLPVVVAAWSLLVCAITLVAAATLYGETVATGGLRQALAEAPPAERADPRRTPGQRRPGRRGRRGHHDRAGSDPPADRRRDRPRRPLRVVRPGRCCPRRSVRPRGAGRVRCDRRSRDARRRRLGRSAGR